MSRHTDPAVVAELDQVSAGIDAGVRHLLSVAELLIASAGGPQAGADITALLLDRFSPTAVAGMAARTLVKLVEAELKLATIAQLAGGDR